MVVSSRQGKEWRGEDRITFVLSRNIADTWSEGHLERRVATATASHSKGRIMAVL